MDNKLFIKFILFLFFYMIVNLDFIKRRKILFKLSIFLYFCICRVLN